MAHYAEYVKRNKLSNSVVHCNFRMRMDEMDMISAIMEKENIPDISKTIKYCIREMYREVTNGQENN